MIAKFINVDVGKRGFQNELIKGMLTDDNAATATTAKAKCILELGA